MDNYPKIITITPLVRSTAVNPPKEIPYLTKTITQQGHKKTIITEGVICLVENICLFCLRITKQTNRDPGRLHRQNGSTLSVRTNRPINPEIYGNINLSTMSYGVRF